MTAEPMVWTCEIPYIDPVAAAASLSGLPGFAFLDSAMQHRTLGRDSLLAAEPFARFRSRQGQSTLDGQSVEGTPLDALRACLAPYRIEAGPELAPFPSGAIGYFGYDLGQTLERVAVPPRRAGLTDDIAFNLYDIVLTIDHARKSCLLVATGYPERTPAGRERRASERLDQFASLLAKARMPEIAEPFPAGSFIWHSNFSRQTYEKAVEKVRDYIRAGDIYQANIAQRFTTDLPPDFDTFGLYLRLRATNPATFCAYLAFEDLTIASSSPERFLKLQGRNVETRPIKGTARRVDNPAQDAAIGEALQVNPKERAENIMIVDLLRNDLSRICEPGSVKVPVLCGLESYASVHHLVSVVTGRMKEGADALDLIAHTFPGGSITGAPKLRAMDIITEIEGDARELYCGAIGAIGFDGSLDTSIAIRTVFMDETKAVLQAGGGVTLLSAPGPEYEETLTKAARVFAAFEEPAEAPAGRSTAP